MAGYKHLSPSSMNTFLKCPKQWYFRYEEGIKIAPGGALILGSAYHSGIETNFRAKVNTGEDEPLDVILDSYSTAFDRRKGEVEKAGWEGRKPGAWKDEGSGLLQTYMIGDPEHGQKAIAPNVIPTMVETPFTIEVDGMDKPIVGYIDLVRKAMIGETIVDHKTSSRKPQAAPDVQSMIYTVAYHATFGPDCGYELHGAVRPGKTTPGRIEVVEVIVPPSDCMWVLDQAVAVEKQIMAGIFPGNPNGWWCSDKYCGYWPICRGRM